MSCAARVWVPLMLGCLLGCLLGCSGAVAQSGSAEAVAECLRDNVPPAWGAQIEVRLRQPDGSQEVRRLAYATRERGREPLSDHWVRMRAPDALAGVVHLFRQTESSWSRWSYLPALDRVSQVKGQGSSSAALEEIVGVRDLDALMRWSEGATLQLAAPREEGGRQVRSINATRRVGTGASAGFERMRGLMDVERCVLLQGEWRDAENRKTRSLSVVPASLRRYGDHWVPQRIDVQQSDGVTAQVHLTHVVIAPKIPRGLFDPDGFHQVMPAALGLE
ncbi:MAG: outer membrane lipoprotein-sorting protein [Polycyclovorans sp.]|nr:hypothetical protein [Polycyclovorans sp.]MDP1544103.1 outer membrane lipoprotein-sorting protein [Polycyclovorans sp.]